MCQERACTPRVFRRNDVRIAQRSYSPRRKVAEVSNGSAYEHERTPVAHRVGGLTA